MNPDRKPERLTYLNASITEQQASIRQKEDDFANSPGAMQSHHDHLRADLTQEIDNQNRILATAMAARDEIEKADYSYRVEPGADVDALVNGEPKQLLMLSNSVSLPDVMVITPKSPLGACIYDKIAGEKGTFKIRDKIHTVEVRSIL